MLDLGEVLAPGEELVSVVSWRGYPPIGRALAVSCFLLGMLLANTIQQVRAEIAPSTEHAISIGVLWVGAVGWTGNPPDDEREALVRKAGGWAGSFGGSSTRGSASWSYHGGSFLTPVWILPFLVAAEVWRVSRWRKRRAAITKARVVALDSEDRFVGQLALSGETSGEEAARRLLRTRVGLLHGPEVEDVLAPGEVVAWEGRPSGFVFPRLRAVAYLLVLLAYSTLIGLDLYSTANGTAPTNQAGGVTTHSFDFGIGTVSAKQTTTWGPPGAGGGTSVLASTWPSPVAFLPVFAAIELVALAVQRARRYGITNLRVLALGWRGKWLGQVARPASASVEGRTLHVSGGLAFEHLDDPEAARSALN